MPRVVSPVTAVLSARVVRSDGWRIDRPAILVDTGVMRVLGMLGRLGLGTAAGRLGGPGGGAFKRIVIGGSNHGCFDGFVFASGDALADDVDVVREHLLLDALGDKAGHQADGGGDDESHPEGELGVDLGSGLVELARVAGGRVDAGPEEDEDVTEEDNQEHHPIPSVRVHQDVHVDGQDGRVGDVAAQPCPFLDVETISRGGSGEDTEDERDEETHHRLVDTISHVSPASLLVTPPTIL